LKRLDFGQTVSLLANLGVIAGIVFLGVELQQNTESLDEARNLAIADAQQARQAQLDESFRSLANSEYLPAIFVKYREQGRDALSDEEFQRLVWQSCSGLARIDTLHAWYERGYVDEEEYNENFRGLVLAFAPRWQDIGIAPLRPSFRQEVDRILREAQMGIDLPTTSAC
jgi:hypothetical protein